MITNVEKQDIPTCMPFEREFYGLQSQYGIFL